MKSIKKSNYGRRKQKVCVALRTTSTAQNSAPVCTHSATYHFGGLGRHEEIRCNAIFRILVSSVDFGALSRRAIP